MFDYAVPLLSPEDYNRIKIEIEAPRPGKSRVNITSAAGLQECMPKIIASGLSTGVINEGEFLLYLKNHAGFLQQVTRALGD